MKKRCTALVALALLAQSCGRSDQDRPATPAAGADSRPAVPGQDWRDAGQEAIQRGADQLLAIADRGRWAFDKEKGPDVGITALACRAVLSAGGAKRLEAVGPALDWLVSMQKEDGAIYDQNLAVYCTSAAMLALQASGDPKYQGALAKGTAFLTKVQSDEGEGLSESSEDYGGVGYGGSGVVNMSTTQFALEAASEAGLPKDDAFYKKALRFLERSQNRSESNDQTHTVDGVEVVPGNDGGGIYRPAESKAGLQPLPDGRRVFRSYGSMTYALLKSYLLCDLDARDPRVQAALTWIGGNWQTEFNPGMEHALKPEARYQGLYYYYLTLARTLGAAQRQKVPLDAPALKDWKEKLARAILSRQAENGSWVNHEGRWWESLPALATSYAVLALQECLGDP